MIAFKKRKSTCNSTRSEILNGQMEPTNEAMSGQMSNLSRIQTVTGKSTGNSRKKAKLLVETASNRTTTVQDQQVLSQSNGNDSVWVIGLMSNIEQLLNSFNPNNPNSSGSSTPAYSPNSAQLTSSSSSQAPSPGSSTSSSSSPSSSSSVSSYSLGNLNTPSKQQGPLANGKPKASAQDGLTNRVNSSAASQIIRTPTSRQIKFHEYKGPPSARRQQLSSANSNTTAKTNAASKQHQQYQSNSDPSNECVKRQTTVNRPSIHMNPQLASPQSSVKSLAAVQVQQHQQQTIHYRQPHQMGTNRSSPMTSAPVQVQHQDLSISNFTAYSIDQVNDPRAPRLLIAPIDLGEARPAHNDHELLSAQVNYQLPQQQQQHHHQQQQQQQQQHQSQISTIIGLNYNPRSMATNELYVSQNHNLTPTLDSTGLNFPVASSTNSNSYLTFEGSELQYERGNLHPQSNHPMVETCDGQVNAGLIQQQSHELQNQQPDQFTNPYLQPNEESYGQQQQNLYQHQSAPVDACELEPSIEAIDELLFSEFIDLQDVPLNVDESDWLKKFLPPCQ